MQRAQQVLEYWLGPEAERDAPAPELKKRWFTKSDAVDEEIRREFGPDVERAGRGDYDHWQAAPRDNLALVILLDQLTRNIHRGSGEMFRNDAKALASAKQGLARGDDRTLRAAERYFLYMPFMHSETLADQQRCCELMEALARDAPDLDARTWAERHRAIIERFGRFPHRNVLLGRTPTAEEIEFLKQPGSSF